MSGERQPSSPEATSDALVQAEGEIMVLLGELEELMEVADPRSLAYREATIYHHHLTQATEEIAVLDKEEGPLPSPGGDPGTD